VEPPELAVVEDPDDEDDEEPLLSLGSPVPRIPPTAELPLGPLTEALLALEAKSEAVSPDLHAG